MGITEVATETQRRTCGDHDSTMARGDSVVAGGDGVTAGGDLLSKGQLHGGLETTQPIGHLVQIGRHLLNQHDARPQSIVHN